MAHRTESALLGELVTNADSWGPVKEKKSFRHLLKMVRKTSFREGILHRGLLKR